MSVELQVVLDDKVIHTIIDPTSKPTTGEFIEVPYSQHNRSGPRELYITKVTNSYPAGGALDQTTFIKCECIVP